MIQDPHETSQQALKPHFFKTTCDPLSQQCRYQSCYWFGHSYCQMWIEKYYKTFILEKAVSIILPSSISALSDNRPRCNWGDYSETKGRVESDLEAGQLSCKTAFGQEFALQKYPDFSTVPISKVTLLTEFEYWSVQSHCCTMAF